MEFTVFKRNVFRGRTKGLISHTCLGALGSGQVGSGDLPISNPFCRNVVCVSY